MAHFPWSDDALFLFLDETFPEGTGRNFIRFGGFACAARRFLSLPTDFFLKFSQAKRRRIELLLKFVTDCPAFALVADAIPEKHSEELRWTGIGDIAPANEVWSLTFGMTVSAMLAYLHTGGWLGSQVAVFVHDRTLKQGHWSVTEASMKRALERAIAETSSLTTEVASVRRVSNVGHNRSRESHGVGLAHWVAKLPAHGVEARPGTYAHIELSAHVSRVMRLFREAQREHPAPGG